MPADGGASDSRASHPGRLAAASSLALLLSRLRRSRWCTRPGRPTCRSRSSRGSGARQLTWFALGAGGRAGDHADLGAPPRVGRAARVPAGRALLLVALLFSARAPGRRRARRAGSTIGGVRLGQPSELAKLAVVLMLAKVLSAACAPPRSRCFELWQPALVVLVPWLLIMAQPDLGTGHRVHRASSSRCSSGPACRGRCS